MISYNTDRAHFPAVVYISWLKRSRVSYSLAFRLNGYMYSNGKSLNVALFILMANHFFSRVTLQLLGVKNIPCRVASLINIFN